MQHLIILSKLISIKVLIRIFSQFNENMQSTMSTEKSLATEVAPQGKEVPKV